MFLTAVLFFIGFYILIKGADFLVGGAVSLARRVGVSGFIIGLLIVGVGTSIPEFAITFFSNILGESDIGLGTVIGSNTFNILFILGFSALFFPLPFKPRWVHRDLIWNVLAVLVVIFAACPLGGGLISRELGFVLFLLFIAWVYKSTRKPEHDGEEERAIRTFTIPISILLMIAGLIGVVLGGNWVVKGAEVFARTLGVSEAVIGLTIVGIGTSLPELAVSFAAAYRKQVGIAIGNIIGSNIFDFLMVLGFSAMARPIPFSQNLVPDAVVTLIATVVLYAFMFIGKRYTLHRPQGAIMVLLYVLYFVTLMRHG